MVTVKINLIMQGHFCGYFCVIFGGDFGCIIFLVSFLLFCGIFADFEAIFFYFVCIFVGFWSHFVDFGGILWLTELQELLQVDGLVCGVLLQPDVQAGPHQTEPAQSGHLPVQSVFITQPADAHKVLQ